MPVKVLSTQLYRELSQYIPGGLKRSPLRIHCVVFQPASLLHVTHSLDIPITIGVGSCSLIKNRHDKLVYFYAAYAITMLHMQADSNASRSSDSDDG